MTLKQALTAYLWTSGVPIPLDYMTLILCRDVYHCTPSQLRNEKMGVVQRHLTSIGVEQKISEMKRTTK